MFTKLNNKFTKNYFYSLGLIFILLSLSSCGFYLRGSKKINVDSNVAYLQAVNFSNELYRQLTDKIRGVNKVRVGKESSSEKDYRLISVISEDIYTNENILDATTYNIEIRINYQLRYKIEKPNDEGGENISSDELIIERRATVLFSEADRLSGELKLSQAKEGIYGEVAIALIQAALRY